MRKLLVLLGPQWVPVPEFLSTQFLKRRWPQVWLKGVICDGCCICCKGIALCLCLSVEHHLPKVKHMQQTILG